MQVLRSLLNRGAEAVDDFVSSDHDCPLVRFGTCKVRFTWTDNTLTSQRYGVQACFIAWSRDR